MSQPCHVLIPQPAQGFLDTDDLCRAVLRAGYKIVCCKDLFIHSFGSRNFAIPVPRSREYGWWARGVFREPVTR